uniref:Uncharacterized protein n=1 Tax=Eutreptiella gymnastica TaxID=73025 RepID=A0A7S4CVS2_9EUGL
MQCRSTVGVCCGHIDRACWLLHRPGGYCVGPYRSNGDGPRRQEWGPQWEETPATKCPAATQPELTGRGKPGCGGLCRAAEGRCSFEEDMERFAKTRTVQ